MADYNPKSLTVYFANNAIDVLYENLELVADENLKRAITLLEVALEYVHKINWDQNE